MKGFQGLDTVEDAAREFTRDDWRPSKQTSQVFWECQLVKITSAISFLTRDRKTPVEVRYPRTFLVQPDRAVWAAAVMLGRVLCHAKPHVVARVPSQPQKNTIDVVSQSDLFAFQLPPHKLQMRRTAVLTNLGETS